ncbi:MAG: PHP domain-containing protein [Methylotenera sp.]|nr:PHP domain-containing protein [Oligoflexia bacterium]
MTTPPTRVQAIELLDELRHLMELRGENPFKIRAFEKASNLLEALDEKTDLAELAKTGRLTDLPGIGKGISEVLTEFHLTGKSKARDEMAESLPAGLLELTTLPGLGPKKAIQLIEALDVHSIGELEYACRENRVLKLKGFGEKAQIKFLEGIEFLKGNAGQQRLVDVFDFAEQLLGTLVKEMPQGLRVSEAGMLRRRMETLAQLDFLIEKPAGEAGAQLQKKMEETLSAFLSRVPLKISVQLHFAERACFGYELAKLSSSAEHWNALGNPQPFEAKTELDFYTHLNLPLIPAETRETGEEVAMARSGALEQLLPWNGVQGVFHNHTTRSDGVASLEQMVEAAQKLGYKYIGISDHSQTAVYAQGLKGEDLLDQEQEIRVVQKKFPDIRIFWGIESDILADGSLDYDDQVLKRFDFVVASVHSRFQMDKEAMTDRILTAIRNPYTRFLGHATGRLLLGRKGYDIHMDRIIAEAARCNVAIEINANPARLDIDWRWGKHLRDANTPVSINPDAHATEGLKDTVYGISVARKALLPIGQIVNSRSVQDVERWLQRK